MVKSKKLWELYSGDLKKNWARIPAGMMVLVLISWFAASWTFFPQTAQADVEWKIIKDLDLKAKPLDIAPSADGRWLFILTPGEVLIFSIPEGNITDRFPVDKDFDRIAPLPRPDLLTLTSSTKNALQVIRFEPIYKMNLTGLPFKGRQEAPVTIAVFSDYQ
jgi:hypothetical protein